MFITSTIITTNLLHQVRARGGVKDWLIVGILLVLMSLSLRMSFLFPIEDQVGWIPHSRFYIEPQIGWILWLKQILGIEKIHCLKWISEVGIELFSLEQVLKATYKKGSTASYGVFS
jgi:hypothetical protein